MSPALAIRFTLLMTLVPDADYMEVIETLLGDLVLVPWQRPYRVPTAAVACTWREALGPAPLERLRDLALAGVDGEHRSQDYRAITVGDLEVGSIDGSLIRVPDTPANREAFGSAGTADDSSPFPQLRELRISAASTRATFGVTTGPAGAGGARDKGEAEQVLLDKALKDYRYLFTPWRLWVMDRNYPGVPRIKALLETGTHVLIRVRDGITLRRAGDFLPGRLLPGGDLRRRDHADRPGDRIHRHRGRPRRPRAVLPDHRPARPRCLPRPPARAGLSLAVDRVGNLPEGGQVRDQRRRAVHRADAPLLRPRPWSAQEHAAWVTAVELARATARAAAAVAIPARRGRRAGQPVHPRQISFTAARRAVIASVRSGAATASLPAALTAANQDAILAGLARRRVQVDRHRHRDRKTKARPGFPPGGPRLATRTAPAEISVCQPLTA